MRIGEYEKLEFKYSSQKLLKRIALFVGIGILGILSILLLKNIYIEIIPALLFPFVFMTVIGLVTSAYSFWRLLLKGRIFLTLDTFGLHYRHLELVSRAHIPIFYNLKMTWDEISSVHMEYGFFIKSMVVLTLKKQKRGKNLEQKIYVICSEHDAEYILEAIKRFMRSSKAA